jgi:hypothetical protein
MDGEKLSEGRTQENVYGERKRERKISVVEVTSAKLGKK